ncbi:MAG: ADP-ribosylglycohydrolase family protein [Planctomycetaceae bacterium]
MTDTPHTDTPHTGTPRTPVTRADRLVAEPDRAALLGSLVADALAMPAHWYYDRAALDRDYPDLAAAAAAGRFVAPRNPHPDSILWRSRYDCPGPQGDILREQAAYWGQRGVHYHQFLAAGENTVNHRLGVELAALVRRNRHYDPERWLEDYVAFMLAPGRHRDTYVEEYHRHFFTNLAQGRKPINCGVRDEHIGGLAQVPALLAALGGRHPDVVRLARVHVGLTHKDPEVLDAAVVFARILVRVCRGEDLREAIDHEAGPWLPAARRRQWADLPDRVVVGARVSSACYISEAFPASLWLAWKYAGDFLGGAVANVLVGGDNCNRGAVVGGLLAASSPLPGGLVNGLVCRATVMDVFDAEA